MSNQTEKPETKDKALVAPKQKYFSPEVGQVEADSLAEATDIIKQKTKAKAETKAKEIKG